MNLPSIHSSLLLVVTAFFTASPLLAQSSVSIGEGYSCITNFDDSKTLAREGEGAELTPVKFSRALTYAERQQELIDSKREKLSDILGEKPSLLTKLLLKFLKSFNITYPTSGVATEFTDTAERKEVVASVRGFLKTRYAALREFIKAAKACKGKSSTPNSRNPDYFTPSLKLVSFKGTRTAYAGFVAYTAPRTNPFNKTPGGFNICQKLSGIDPTNGQTYETRLYTGVGDKICFVGGGVVDDDAVAACNATLPSGTVGRFLRAAQGGDLSEDGLRNLEQIAVGITPTVVFLGLNNFEGSRDKALELCEEF